MTDWRQSKIMGPALLWLLFGTPLAAAQDLQAELFALEQLRKGKDTPLDEVDRRGAGLLQKYTDPKDRGRIYYQLAHIHAQSALRRPDQVVQYAEKALECPLEPSQRLRLYVYRGDALQMGKEPFPKKRKRAVVPYLQGLRGTRLESVREGRRL
jgi:hypothetical protein